MMNPFLLVQRRYRLCPDDLAARGVHSRIRDVTVDDPDHIFDQVSAVVHLGNDPVSVELPVGVDRAVAPTIRTMSGACRTRASSIIALDQRAPSTSSSSSAFSSWRPIRVPS